MSTSRRTFTREFKLAAVKRLGSGVPVGRVARELEVNSHQLHVWKRQFAERPNSAFSGQGRRRAAETEMAELERKIGQQTMEIDFLRTCLRQIEDLRRSQVETVNPRSSGKSGKNGRKVAR